MMMKIVSVVIVLLICISCKQQESKEKETELKSIDSLPPVLMSTIEKFAIPFNGSMPDRNELFFCSSNTFDTSFLVHFKKLNDNIYGVLYEVLPAYHRDIEDFTDEKDQLLFFEGYSFRIDTIRWMNIIGKANELLKGKDRWKSNKSCFDCPLFFLAYDLKTTISYGQDQALFEEFAQYLKDSLLCHYINKRQPVLHR